MNTNTIEEKNINSIFLKSSFGTFGVMFFELILKLLASIIFARILGVEQYGIYVFIITLATTIAIPIAPGGFPTLIVRETSILYDANNMKALKGFLQKVFIIIAIICLLIISISFLVSPLISNKIIKNNLFIFWLSLLLIPFLSFNATLTAILRGFNKIITSQLNQNSIRIFLLIGISLSFLFISNSDKLNAQSIIVMEIIASIIAVFITVLFVKKIFPTDIFEEKADFSNPKILKSSLRFLSLSVVNLLNMRIDTLMVGILLGAKAVGIYAVVLVWGRSISLFSQAVSLSVGPLIASLYINGEIKKLNSILANSTRLVCFLLLPIIILLCIFAQPLINTFYGIEFAQASPVLIIVLIGLALSNLLGPTNVVLNMVKLEKYTLIILILSIIINIILSVFLIPIYGLIGAAVTIGLCGIISKVISWFLIKNKTPINYSIIGSNN